jgi:hypothetical protein
MIDNQQQQHDMLLETTHPSGAEQWSCPSCGRRMVMKWSPKYTRIILNAGDEYAAHSGGKGGLSLNAANIMPEKPNDLPISNEYLQLDLWEAWLNNEDSVNWWPDDD